MKPTALAFLIFCLFSSHYTFGQTGILSAGITSHKSASFYWENGVSVQYYASEILNNKLLLGFHVVNSRLGSAIQSNAIKQGREYVSTHYRMRGGKKLNVLTGFNIGFFHANYESEIFDDLTSNSLLLAFDSGVQYKVVKQVSIQSTFGYNFFNGNGKSGAGTLYPVYYQFSLLWNFKK